ncbi:cyclin-D4-2 [Tripterygium wilfordii]|uniref:B-like cyclin n=1 Tax=Tripterygium wilfordii TaxID=458696 RepID=A0A7J7DLW5_TRIWF|nr:cyclin-D4-2 [Tripterygium wilfordii]
MPQDLHSLLCTESPNMFFDDLDGNACCDWIWGLCHSWQNQKDHLPSQEPVSDNSGSNSLMGFPLLSEERVKQMIETGEEYLPNNGYNSRLRTEELMLSVRSEAVDWILKASIHHGFGPLSVYLSVNYLDRFLSLCEFPGQDWIVQLLAVSCLSIAAKMDEVYVPHVVDLQELVGKPEFLFEAKSIKAMELMIMSRLKWRLHSSSTPYAYIDYFLNKTNNNYHFLSSASSKSIQLILSTIKDIQFLEFRPSEIAAAVAISVSMEMQSIDRDKIDRVVKCVELIEDLSLSSDQCGATTPNFI